MTLPSLCRACSAPPAWKRRLRANSVLFSVLLAALLWANAGFAAALSPDAAKAPAQAAARQQIPIPKGLFPKGVSPESPAETILAALLGIPYRNDGAVNEAGEYTLFADQTKRFSTPGLNCSGLVLEASRFLLGKNFNLDEARRDRLGDSGPASPHGEDWDFGWDLIMNISEGFSRSLLLPGNTRQDPAQASGFSPLGYDPHAAATWRELPGRLRPGHLYLFSLSVEGRRKNYGLTHYHVGLIHVDAKGRAWLYQTTGKGKSANRRDIGSREGQKSFQQAFANTGNNKRMLLVLEVKLPE